MIKFFNFVISFVINFMVNQPFIKNKIKGKNVDKIIDLYSNVNYTKNFVKFRFWFGPLHEVNELVPRSGTILDLGCGEGILTNFLAVSATKRKMIGVELNASRVKQARKGVKNTKFLTGSALTLKLPKADAIVVSHVFHHLGSRMRQEELLDVCFNHLKTKGKLIIAEVDRQFSLRYFFGWITDILLVPIFFEKKLLDLQIYHRGRKEWKALLQKHGFKVTYIRVTKDRIYPEVIMVAAK